MSSHSKTTYYESPWNTVVSAFWIKYPSEKARYVKSVDTIARQIDPETQTMKQRRLISLEHELPGWVERLFRCKLQGLAMEETEVDYRSQTLTLKTSNISLSKFFNTVETATYKADPDNPGRTIYSSEQHISFLQCPSLKGVLERTFLTSAKNTAGNGYNIMRERIDQSKSLYLPAEWEQILEEMKIRAHQRVEIAKMSVEERIQHAKETIDSAKTNFEKTTRSMKKAMSIGKKVVTREIEEAEKKAIQEKIPEKVFQPVVQSNGWKQFLSRVLRLA